MSEQNNAENDSDDSHSSIWTTGSSSSDEIESLCDETEAVAHHRHHSLLVGMPVPSLTLPAVRRRIGETAMGRSIATVPESLERGTHTSFIPYAPPASESRSTTRRSQTTCRRPHTWMRRAVVQSMRHNTRRCATFSTCLWMASLVLWVVTVGAPAYLRSTDTPEWLHTIPPATARRSNLQTLHLTVHERSQLRKQERQQRQRDRKRARQDATASTSVASWTTWTSWFSFGGQATDTTFTKSTTSTVIPTRQRRPGNSETLPRECVRPEWQDYHFPTCNDVHDIDLAAILARRDTSSSSQSQLDIPSPVGFVASGLWRSVWAVPARATKMTPPGATTNTIRPEIVVLKLMRREHDVTPRNLDRHRRDALVMERLTSSPYVVNAYAHCANSVVTEYLDSPLDDFIFDTVATMVDTDTNTAPNSTTTTDNTVWVETNISATHRLQWALDVARGIQALHDMPGGGAIVHADVQPKQFLVSATTGVVKVNDFNRCRFMALNQTSQPAPETNDTQRATTHCAFRIPTAPGKMRSPEEYSYQPLDEKLDMYAVANVLYSIFTQQEAWFDWNEREAKRRIQDGTVPDIDVRLDTTIAIRNDVKTLIQRAYALDPTQRIGASALASELERLLQEHADATN